MAAGVVGRLPPRRHDRPLAHLDDAIAAAETERDGRLDDFHVRPLEAMAVDVIGNLAQQDAFRFQDAVGLRQEGRVQVREVVAGLGRRLQDQAEAGVEILGVVLATA